MVRTSTLHILHVAILEYFAIAKTPKLVMLFAILPLIIVPILKL